MSALAQLIDFDTEDPASTEIWIISSDTTFSARLQEVLKQASDNISTLTPDAKTGAIASTDIPKSATVVIITDSALVTRPLLQRLAKLADNTQIIVPEEVEGHPELRLQGAHAIAVSPKTDLLMYEYRVKALSIGEQIARLYGSKGGFCIGQEEAQRIRDVGGDPTYGEITIASTEKLFNELVPLTAQDVFYDLGAGIGKLVLWVHLATPTRKVVGVELSDTRYALAAEMVEEIKKEKYKNGLTAGLSKTKSITLQHADIAKIPLDEATVIFMCATCFSDEFVARMADIFAQLKPGTRIITLKELPPRAALCHSATYTLPMTWSPEKGSAVYLYTVITPEDSPPCKTATKT